MPTSAGRLQAAGAVEGADPISGVPVDSVRGVPTATQPLTAQVLQGHREQQAAQEDLGRVGEAGGAAEQRMALGQPAFGFAVLRRSNNGSQSPSSLASSA